MVFYFKILVLILSLLQYYSIILASIPPPLPMKICNALKCDTGGSRRLFQAGKRIKFKGQMFHIRREDYE